MTCWLPWGSLKLFQDCEPSQLKAAACAVWSWAGRGKAHRSYLWEAGQGDNGVSSAECRWTSCEQLKAQSVWCWHLSFAPVTLNSPSPKCYRGKLSCRISSWHVTFNLQQVHLGFGYSETASFTRIPRGFIGLLYKLAHFILTMKCYGIVRVLTGNCSQSKFVGT